MQTRLTFFDLLLFAVMVTFFVIGVYESIYKGVAMSYWLFMISSLAFLVLNFRWKKRPPVVEGEEKNKKQGKIKKSPTRN